MRSEGIRVDCPTLRFGCNAARGVTRVRKVRTDGAYSASVVLASGARAPLSRDRVRELEAILKTRG